MIECDLRHESLCKEQIRSQMLNYKDSGGWFASPDILKTLCRDRLGELASAEPSRCLCKLRREGERSAYNSQSIVIGRTGRVKRPSSRIVLLPGGPSVRPKVVDSSVSVGAGPQKSP